jgi:phosphatidylserine/phosphatidylglycerophosphate/cardiolipin synthase-like enzyme
MRKLKVLLFPLLLLFCSSPEPRAGIEVYFSPEGGGMKALVKTIGQARSTVHVAVFSFTLREAAQALVDAAARGVEVRVVLDEEEKNDEFSKLTFLLRKNIPLRIDENPGYMHDKFAVIDGKVVITGSYNWTASAEFRNRENLLVIDDVSLAKKYEKVFKTLWEQAKPAVEEAQEIPPANMPYIGNRNSKCLHEATCANLPAPRNRVYFSSKEEALKEGYKPCHRCVSRPADP